MKQPLPKITKKEISRVDIPTSMLTPELKSLIARGRSIEQRLKEHLKQQELNWIESETSVLRARLGVADSGDKVGVMVDCPHYDVTIRQMAIANIRSRSAMRLVTLSKTRARMIGDARARLNMSGEQLQLDLGVLPTPNQRRRVDR